MAVEPKVEIRSYVYLRKVAEEVASQVIDHQRTGVPNRPVWADMSNPSGGLNPYIDEHRMRRFKNDAYRRVGASFNFYTPRDKRMNRNHSLTEVWGNFFRGDDFKDVVDWLQPGMLDSGGNYEDKIPLVHYLRPHGGFMGRASYSYFESIEARDLGQRHLVDDFYENIRNLRNNGVDACVHIGNPDRNEEYGLHGDSGMDTIKAQLDYGKVIACLDNCVAFPTASRSMGVMQERWLNGLGAATEGAPKPGSDWAKAPFTFLNWADSAKERFIEQNVNTSRIYPKVGTQEFDDAYGDDRLWIFPLQSKHVPSPFPYQSDADATDKLIFLGEVAELSKLLGTSFKNCVVVIDSTIIRLAESMGMTVADFAGDI